MKMKRIGKCPYCTDGIIHLEKKSIRGRQTNIYACSNARWTSEDGEMFEPAKDSTCSFRIWGNSLSKWGKGSISIQEIKRLLKYKEIKMLFYTLKTKKEYKKSVVLDKEYGISVIWES